MNKNTKTYLLLVLVLGIWGIIGYRIFSVVSPPSEEQPIMTSTNFMPIKKSKRDTFSIKANYRDPFLGTPYKPKTEKKVKPRLSKPQAFDIDVNYTGSMIDNDSKRRIFFVSINGEQYLMEKGRTIEGVRLEGGSAERITVRYKNIRKKIALQQ